MELSIQVPGGQTWPPSDGMPGNVHHAIGAENMNAVADVNASTKMALVCAGIAKTFGGVKALKGVDFTVSVAEACMRYSAKTARGRAR